MIQAFEAAGLLDPSSSLPSLALQQSHPSTSMRVRSRLGTSQSYDFPSINNGVPNDKIGSLFCLWECQPIAAMVATTKEVDLMLWHRQLGHIGFTSIWHLFTTGKIKSPKEQTLLGSDPIC